MSSITDWILGLDHLPRSQSYAGDTTTLWLQVVGDLLVAIAFVAIPATVLYFLRHRRELVFRRLFALFAVVMLGVAAVHLAQIWTTWWPTYAMEGMLKVSTGVLSVAMAALVYSRLPRALALPSTSELERTNRELEREVSERQRAENELAQALTELSDLMEAVPDIIGIIDPGGALVRWNRRLEWVTGYAPEELRKRSAGELFLTDEPEELQTAFRDAYVRGYAGVEGDLRCRDDRILPYHFAVGTTKNERGEVVELTIVGRDISDRRSTAHLQASLHEKELLLKELHHRVKNNLQVVVSLLNLQSGYIEDEQAREIFRESQNRVRLMAAMHEALYRSNDLTRLDGESFIRDITTSLARTYVINPEAIRVNIDIDQSHIGTETAVPCGLIINELVSNAMKHAFPGGRGEIRVALQRAADGTNTLRVSDDGVGLPDEESWRSADSLGWQLVNALTGQLGGRIEVRSRGGTRVTITFPETNTMREESHP